jgi:hypothetical protein
MDEAETSLEAETLLNDCIEHCRELGLSAWGVRKLLAKRLRELDAERDEAAGLSPQPHQLRERKTS